MQVKVENLPESRVKLVISVEKEHLHKKSDMEIIPRSAEAIKILSVEYERAFNERMQDIFSSGYSLHNDSNQWLIQSTGYGDKDFTAMEWNGDNQKEFDTIDKAIKFIDKKK